MDELDQMLALCDKRRKIVVTDSLFSMDGDFAKLKVRLTFQWVFHIYALDILFRLQGAY